MARYQTSLFAVVLTLYAGAASWAQNGRDFAALYELTDAVPVGEEVLLTFSADLYNYSGEDVVGATVELRGPLGSEVYASFPAIEIADRASVRLVREVVVPRAEYEDWQRGAAPLLTLEFLDGAGGSRHCAAETARAIFFFKERP